MVVELVVEAHGIATRILPDFGKKQAVESGAFGACLAASGFRYQSRVILRERHAFEAQVDVVLYPRLQPSHRDEAAFLVVPGKVTVEAMGQTFLLEVGTELCQK